MIVNDWENLDFPQIFLSIYLDIYLFLYFRFIQQQHGFLL